MSNTLSTSSLLKKCCWGWIPDVMVSVSLTLFSVCWVLINSNMCNVHLDANTGRSRSMMRQQESESFL